jgi:hypothetical protein
LPFHPVLDALEICPQQYQDIPGALTLISGYVTLLTLCAGELSLNYLSYDGGYQLFSSQYSLPCILQPLPVFYFAKLSAIITLIGLIVIKKNQIAMRSMKLR